MIWNGSTTNSQTHIQKPETMSTAQEAMLKLLSGQCEATARTIANKFGLDVKDCLAEVAAHVESIDLTSFTKGPKKRSKKTTRKPAAAAERCLARVWGTGSGNDQCKLNRCDQSEYCKRHDKAAQEESTPCTLVPWSEETRCGKKIGLFCGRIDQDIPIADSHGVIRILWKNTDVVKDMEKKIGDGEWRMPTGHKPKRKSKKSANDGAKLEKLLKDAADSTKPASDDGIAEAFAAQSGGTTVPTDDVVVEASADATTKVVDDVVDEEAADEPTKVVDDAVDEEAADEPTKVVDDVKPSPSNKTEASSEEEEEIACEEREHNGTLYLVEPSSNTIYNEDGMEIGTWTADGPELN